MRAPLTTCNVRSTLVLLGLLASAPAALAQPPSSATYSLVQNAVGGAGARSESASFVLDGTLSQDSVVGEATSASLRVQSGFWTSASLDFDLTVLAGGSGDGSLSGAGIACTATAGATGGDCTATVAHSTELALVATPDPGHTFDGWSGCDSTATTTEPDDTCTVQLLSDRAVTASFVALGSIGDRVWRDVDGDGAQDAGEPGLDGITVELAGPSGPLSAVTAGGGLYAFADLLPGAYTVSVDPATLPAGVVASFDLDGVATPHTADVSLADGAVRADADFGYQPLADLALSLDDSPDPLPGGDTLVYTVTVENLGPSPATGVAVTGSLPGGTALVATSGCAGDPAGAPVCNLGDLGVGAMVSFTVEVSIDPAPPTSMTYTLSVAAAEADPAAGNDSDSETTSLDAAPPRVIAVDTVPSTTDGALTACESVHGQQVGRLLVTFDEELIDGGGAAGDVSDPASWLLVGAGPDGELATAGCAGGATGDDLAIVPAGVIWSPGTEMATLELDGTLAPDLYRLFACGTGASPLRDLAGNPLDGDSDGGAGDDFVRFFRADPRNELANGHFDCDLGGWTLESTHPDEIAHVEDDSGESADSGSAAVTNLTASEDFGLAQCVPVEPQTLHTFGVDIRMSTTAAGIVVVSECSFFSMTDCAASALSSSSLAVFLGDTGGTWLRLTDDWTPPAESASVLCFVAFSAPGGAEFEAWVDRAELMSADEIFTDGFESGDTSAWSTSIP